MSNRSILQHGRAGVLSDHKHQVCQPDGYLAPSLLVPGEDHAAAGINAEQKRAAIAHHELPAARAAREHPLLARNGLGAGVVSGSGFHYSPHMIFSSIPKIKFDIFSSSLETLMPISPSCKS